MIDFHGREVKVKDEAKRCPWCDGTGEFVQMARTATEAMRQRDGIRAGLTLVPCGWCKATGRARA